MDISEIREFLEDNDLSDVEEIKQEDDYVLVKFYYDFDKEELAAAKTYSNEESDFESGSDEWYNEYYIPYLKEIAEESRIVIRKVDRDKSFGREQGFGIVRYYIDVELDRSWAVREDFRQYDVIGKYYSETDEYKKARKDWDGITLPEEEW